jgi:hypothetical protein
MDTGPAALLGAAPREAGSPSWLVVRFPSVERRFGEIAVTAQGRPLPFRIRLRSANKSHSSLGRNVLVSGRSSVCNWALQSFR